MPKFRHSHDLGHVFAAPGREAKVLLLGASVLAEGAIHRWLQENGYRSQEPGDRPIKLRVSVEIEEDTDGKS